MRLGQCVVGLFALIACQPPSAVTADGESLTPCANCVSATIGPAEFALGPNSTIVDNEFFTIRAGGTIRGYSANATTYHLDGKGIYGLAPVSSVIGPSGTCTSSSYDDSGAWLESALWNGTKLWAFYHAESADVSDLSQSYQTIASAVSTDNGLTFGSRTPILTSATTKPGCAYGSFSGSIGYAQPSVFPWAGHYWAYFTDRSNPAWPTTVAQSTNINGPWTKWYNGGWTQPGIGGLDSALSNIPGTKVYPLSNKSSLISIGQDASTGNIVFSLSSNGIDWTSISVADPLLLSSGSPPQWKYRTSTSGELLAYTSLVDGTGDYQMHDDFWLYYMYLPPGGDFGQRYLVRRSVSFATGSSPTPHQVTVALTRYYNGLSQNHWVTTQLPVNSPSQGNYGSFAYEGVVGYLLTKSYPGTAALNDCTWGRIHYFVYPGQTCGGSTSLRTLGYSWKTQQPGTIPIYRCYSSVSQDHFVSSEPNCEGQQAEFLLGYVYPSNSPPAGAVLTRYYNAGLARHRVTTLPGVTSEGGYAYEFFLGSLLTVPSSGTFALHECSGSGSFLSTDANCEGNGNLIQPLGWLWATSHAGTSPLYRYTWNGDHWAGTSYVAGITDALLGYIPNYIANDIGMPLARYYNPSTQNHWTTTTLPGGSFQVDGLNGENGTMGSLMQVSQAGTIALYDCSWGGIHYFVSLDPTCGGGGATTVRLLGYVWSQPHVGATPLYRCYWSQPQDHWASIDPNCEGAQTEFLLGYINQNQVKPPLCDTNGDPCSFADGPQPHP